MSSQSFNANTYSNFTTSTDKTGILPRFPLRDAGDYTAMIKRRSFFREAHGTFSGSPSPLYPIVQSNLTKIISEFGQIQCGTCNGGPFPKS